MKFNEYLSTISPFGLPKCAIKKILFLLEVNFFIEYLIASIREVSVIIPSTTGTFKSALNNIFLFSI